jgi:hypothetical protein
MNAPKGFDIYDINMVYKMQFNAPPQREISFLKLVLKKIKLSIKFIYHKSQNNITVSKPLKKIDILFFGESINNSLVFNPIINNLKKDDYQLIKDNSDFPLVKSIYLSIPFLLDLLKEYIKANSINKKIIKSNPFAFLFSYGKFLLAREILEKYNPKILFMSNDHSPFNRCLLHHSKSMDVKTIYMQHASVSDKFPLLEFDYSLLDGKESFEKYKETSKKNSKVILTGSARYDKFYKTKLNKNSFKIGVSLNQFDDFKLVKDLCVNLKKRLNNIQLVIRPHPNMIDWNRDWFENNNIEYSDSSLVPSNVFLKSLKIQISNVSGIHLDAAMIKVPTVLYQLSKKKIDDQYGYLAQGLIKEAITFDDLLNYIEYPKTLFPKDEIIQYYLASIGSNLEGRVGEFTANYIYSILNKEEAVFEKNNHLKIYEF